MTEIVFTQPELKHKELIQSYYDRFQSRSCERCFSNIFLWSGYEKVMFAEVEETLVFLSFRGGQAFFSWPAGEPGQIERALYTLEVYANEYYGQDLCLYHLTPDYFEQLDDMQPGRWSIRYNRDMADYVYTRESLATLAGKKLHSKRNHINRFAELYPRWYYRPLSGSNRDDAYRVAEKWYRENDSDDDIGKQIEYNVSLAAIRYQDQLGMQGGVLYTAPDEPVAFTIGERLSDDTYVVHIEKAFSEIRGAYPMINREFIRHTCSGYDYVNREEDTGAEGLRKAKLSYKPAFLIEKGIAMIRKED